MDAGGFRAVDGVNILTEKKLLQATVALACLVPIAGGLYGAWQGDDYAANANLDSHMRYLSGLLLGIGIAFAGTIAQIERHSARFRLLTLIVVTGGMCRLLGWLLAGPPDTPMIAALGMELVVTPLLCAWQARLARRMGA